MRARALLLALAALAARAQDRLPLMPGQAWDQGVLATFSTREALVEAAGRRPQAHGLPEGLLLLTLHEGTAWGVRMEGGAPRRPAIWRSQHWGPWERVGGFDLPEGRIRGIFPLAEGRFLIYRAVDPFVEGGRPSFLAVHRLREGHFELEELVDLGLGLWKADRAKGPTPAPGLEDAVTDLSFTFMQVSGGRPYLVAHALGKVLWFSPERGHVQRVATLYGSVAELRARGRKVLWPILGAKPLKDGGLLLACRSEDAVLHAKEDFPDPPLPHWPKGKSREEMAAALSQVAAEEAVVRARVQEAYPDVRWYRVSPEEATFREQPTPEGLPAKLRQLADLRGFNFRMTLHGKALPQAGDDLVPPAPAGGGRRGTGR